MPLYEGSAPLETSSRAVSNWPPSQACKSCLDSSSLPAMVEGKVHVKLLTVYQSTEWNPRPPIAINDLHGDIFNQFMVTSLLLYDLHVATYCIIVLIWLEMQQKNVACMETIMLIVFFVLLTEAGMFTGKHIETSVTL